VRHVPLEQRSTARIAASLVATIGIPLLVLFVLMAYCIVRFTGAFVSFLDNAFVFLF
jgi:hypothetical protein